MSVCCPAVLSLLTGLYCVHGLHVSSLCPVACWHVLPPLSFQKVLFFSPSLFLFFSTMRSFFFFSKSYSYGFTLMALTVVIHSFVADSSLLLFGGVFVFVFWVVFSTLCTQVGHCLGFGGGFSSCFSFGVNCVHDWLGQPLIFHLPPAFVVWSFLATDICVQSLPFTAFSAVGICVRLLSLPC